MRNTLKSAKIEKLCKNEAKTANLRKSILKTADVKF